MDEKRKYDDGVHDIPSDAYHASMGVSRSALLDFKKSPYHYWHKHLSDMASHSDPSPSMVAGSLIHTMVLEPNKFDSEFVMRPEMDRRTNAGKLLYNQFTSTLAGRMAVTYDQVQEADAIAKAVRENELANSLLQDCQIEKSIYFTHTTTGVQCKVRPDAWNGSIVVDLKTTTDASYRAFQRSAFSYGYFLQAGMINTALFHEGITLEKFVFIVVEKEPPYAVAIYTLDAEALLFGSKQFQNLIQSYAQCQQNDKWPGFGLQVLSVPGYANYEIEVEYEQV